MSLAHIVGLVNRGAVIAHVEGELEVEVEEAEGKCNPHPLRLHISKIISFDYIMMR